jgi:predicted nucleic acid-binding protein
MILVDTSVWVDHLRSGNARLRELLTKGDVVCHPFVIGEIACGKIQNRRELLSLLGALPSARALREEEAHSFLENHSLMGSGVGWIDVHLLGSSVLARASLWTLDRRLARVASRLGLMPATH